jgi:VanZ family protein
VRKLFLGAALLWTCFITVCCLVSIRNFESVPVDEVNVDKYVHAAFYFIFTVLWYQFFKLRNPQGNKRHRLRVFLMAVLFGIFMELCQQFFTTDRSADVTDALANTTGSATAILLLWLLERIRNKKIPNL